MKQYVILRKPETVATAVINDPSMTLYGWQMFIADLIAKHGPNAVLSTDVGSNNVELLISTPASAVTGFTGAKEIIGMTAEDAAAFNEQRRSNMPL